MLKSEDRLDFSKISGVCDYISMFNFFRPPTSTTNYPIICHRQPQQPPAPATMTIIENPYHMLTAVNDDQPQHRPISATINLQ